MRWMALLLVLVPGVASAQDTYGRWQRDRAVAAQERQARAQERQADAAENAAGSRIDWSRGLPNSQPSMEGTRMLNESIRDFARLQQEAAQREQWAAFQERQAQAAERQARAAEQTAAGLEFERKMRDVERAPVRPAPAPVSVPGPTQCRAEVSAQTERMIDDLALAMYESGLPKDKVAEVFTRALRNIEQRKARRTTAATE